MKIEFSSKPEKIEEFWSGELTAFSWEDFVTAIPSPLFLISTYKSNGKENACLQSWSTFIGDSGVFICIIGSVSKGGHLYQSLKETKCCVLNFPSNDVYKKCAKTMVKRDICTISTLQEILKPEKQRQNALVRWNYISEVEYENKT